MDPFSLTVGIAGLVAFADGLAKKGYQYLRAAQNCEENVKQLLAELDLLGGVLRRLQQWAEDEEKMDGSENNLPIEIDYIDECQNTLREIRVILLGFEKQAKSIDAGSAGLRTSTSAMSSAALNETIPDKAKKRSNLFQRLSRNDLKWPLSKSKTSELITQLERHKATCIFALSAGTASDTNKILGQQRKANIQLAEQGTNLKKVLEMTLAEKHGELANKILEWYSPVDPLAYHQAARTIYHQGTGRWFVNGPEFLEWQKTANSALWVYGIPGAGKTILSSLVIEETFNLQKNLKASGIAYYYCTFRDAATQKPSYILGSFVRQLAEQNENAFLVCKSFHARHHPEGRPPSLPAEAEIGELLQEMSQHFTEVSLILDGLDECGSAVGVDRMELTRVLSELHEPSRGRIRIAIASRKEQDIASFLGSFTSISIAAMSSDLELYIEAIVASRGRGKIRDSELRDEIIDVLSSGAEGMFQWVKCQIDYLFTLPNDAERRKALKSLPPDLPQTYIRILERLDRDLSSPTQILIRRVLIWLAFESKQPANCRYSLDLESIAIAVSINIDCDTASPSPPPPQPCDIASWCSSLVTVDEARNSITFSHFSVKEFLVTSPDEVSSPVARKYLLQESRDKPYMAEVCLTYLTSQNLPLMIDWNKEGALADFDRKFQFYRHAAFAFWVYLESSDAAVEESVSSRRFFTPLANCSFTFWQQYVVCRGSYYDRSVYYGITRSPLCLAAYCKLVRTVLRMVSAGADVNAGRDDQTPPLHCALAPVYDALCNRLAFDWAELVEEDPQRSLAMVEALITHGAEVNHCIEVVDVTVGKIFIIDPCAFAFLRKNELACRVLLENGARINPEIFNKMLDVLESALDYNFNGYGSILDLVLSGIYIQDSALRQRLNEVRGDLWQIRRENNPAFAPDSCDLILTVRYGNQAAFERLIETSTNLEARDSDGKTALYYAVQNFDYLFASALLKKGADVRAVNNQDDYAVSPLLLAYKTWKLWHVREVFDSNNCSRLTPAEASQIMHQACIDRNDKLLSYVLAHSDHPQLVIDLPPDFTATPAVLRVLSKHALLNSSLTFSTMLAAYKDGYDVILSEVLAQCTAAEIDEFRLVALKEYLPYNRSTVRVLLKNDLVVFGKDKMLLTACNDGHHDIVELLLASGASANFLGMEGSRPVHHAAWHLDILQTLTSKGANLANRNRHGETALHLASARGALDCVKWLLERGVSIDAKTAYGHVALHDAAQAGYDLVCQYLLKSGADFRIHTKHTGSTPLHYAAEYGHLQVVKTLLNFAGELLARDKWGGTPLHTAAFAGRVKVIESILEAAPVKNSPVINIGSSGTSAGEVLLPDETVNTEEVLMDRRRYINLQNADGDTALMHAVEGGHVRVIAALLREGGNPVIANNKGNLPIHTAAAVNHTAILTLLAQSAPMVDAVNYDGNTALHLAAEKCNIAAIQVILDLKPDLTIVNHRFMTALDVVQKHQNEGWELCQKLLRDARSKASDRASKQRMVLYEDLLKTLDQIKLHLIHRQDLYGLFLGILRRDPSCAINITYVVNELSTLFQNNADQIKGINKLLPPGYKIECSTYDASNSTDAKNLGPGMAQQLRSTYEHVCIDWISSEQLPSEQVPPEQVPTEQVPTEQDTNHLTLKELASLVKSWPTRLAVRGIHHEAEEIYRAVIQSQEALLEADSPGMLATIHNLAYLTCLRIEPQDAEALLRRVLLTGETLKGDDRSRPMDSTP